MLRDFPVCAGLCQNSNINFCFVDKNKNEFSGGEETGNETMHYYISRSYNGKIECICT